jgi:hypothetical protein
MQQNLVLWGDIGTDRKALMAIYLNEPEKKVMIHAFPKEVVTAELQEQLFAWKNGADFNFPEDGLIWEVDANGEDVLPREIRVDKPEFLARAREFWTKRLMSKRIVAVCEEELSLIRQLVENAPEYEDEQWKKTEALWQKINEYKKENDLSWEQVTQLKVAIDEVFGMLKGKKRLNVEKEKAQAQKIARDIEQQLDMLRAQLIYPEEWNKIFDKLKALQEQVKSAPLAWGNKRNAFDKINEVFDSLRQYRKSQNATHTKDRIDKLKKILRTLEQNLEKDQESLDMQKQKLSHYIRGNNAGSEWGGLLKITEDKIKEKQDKIADIKKTLDQLIKKLKKEQEAPAVKEAKESKPKGETSELEPPKE